MMNRARYWCCWMSMDVGWCWWTASATRYCWNHFAAPGCGPPPRMITRSGLKIFKVIHQDDKERCFMMFHYSLGAKTADGFKEWFTHVDAFCTCKSPEAASKKTCLQKFASRGSFERSLKQIRPEVEAEAVEVGWSGLGIQSNGEV